MTDKSINIGFKADTKEGKELLKFIQDLGAAGNKAAQNLARVFKSDSVGIAGAASKALSQQKKIFDDLGESGKQLSKILKDQVGAAATQLGKDLDQTNVKLKKSVEEYNNLRRELEKAKAFGGDTTQITSQMHDVQGKQFGLIGQKSDLLRQRQALMGGASSGGAGNELTGMLKGMGGGLSLAAVIAMLAKTISDIPKNLSAKYETASQANMMGVNIGAERMQTIGQLRMSAYTGNLTSNIAKSIVNQNPEQSKQMEQAATNAASAKLQETSPAGAFSASTNIGLDPRTWGSGVDFVSGMISHVMDEKEGGSRTYNKYRMLRENADGLVSQAKNKTTKDYLDKVAIEEQERILGTQSVFDAADRWTQLGWRYGSAVSAKNSARIGAPLGIDAGTIDTMRMGMVGTGGRGSQRYLGSAMGATLRGMDAGLAGSLAGTGAIAGDLLNTVRDTLLRDPMVQETIAKGVATKLGSTSIIGSLGGLTSTIAAGANFSGDATQQRRVIEQNIAGFQAGQNLFSGADSYQKTLNLSNSINVLGKNSSLYAQTALSNLPFETIVSLLNDPNGKSKMPIELTSQGITYEKMKDMASTTFGSTIRNRFIDTGAQDQGSKLTRHILSKYQGNVKAWSAERGGEFGYSEDNARVLGNMLHLIDAGTFSDVTMATGMVRGIAGGDATSALGRGSGVKGRGKAVQDTEGDLIRMTHMENIDRQISVTEKGFINVVQTLKDVQGTIRDTQTERTRTGTQIRNPKVGR
jgi:hypothetical protein